MGRRAAAHFAVAVACGALPAVPAAGAALARGERAWRTYRDASCDALYKVYDGGTLAPVAFGTCAVVRNRSHLTDLAALLKALKPQG